MTGDVALDFFLEDAAAQGLSLAEYERKYGIILPDGAYPNPATARIRRNEVSGGLMGDTDYIRARYKEKRRGRPRR